MPRSRGLAERLLRRLRTGSVALGNQALADEIFLASNGFERWYADPVAYTDTAIAMTAAELARRGAVVDDAAARRLDLAVDRIEAETGTWVFRVTTTPQRIQVRHSFLSET